MRSFLLKTGLLLLLTACAEAGDGGSEAEGEPEPLPEGCDQTTDPTQIRSDGPNGLAACLIECHCNNQTVGAKVAVGNQCASADQACDTTCEFFEAGSYTSNNYCYRGADAPA